MKKAFRISPLAVRQMRRSIWLVPVTVGLIAIWTGVRDSDADFMTAASVAAILVVIAIAVAVRGQRRYERHAAGHSLLITDDGVLFQDGGVELRVPFDAIQELAIKRRKSVVLAIVLKYDGHRRIMSDYEDLGLLAQLLQEKVARERVSTFSWFHV